MQLTPQRLQVNVEYCKSCDTHTWCTHHEEEKYFNTFQKLKHYLEQEFQSQVIVEGNVVPDDFVPIKSAENKYYSQKTNKYVQFPITGAFQITIDGQLVFSKKKTNAWPNLTDIGDKVYFKLYSTQRPRKQNEKSPTKSKRNSPTKKQQRLLSAEPDIKTEKDNRSQNNQSFLDNNDKRTTFYKSKSNHKNFTLTDHFKNYHNQDYKHPIHDSNRDSEQFFNNNQTDNDQENIPSELGSFQHPENNETQFLEFKKNFDAWTNSQSKMRLTELIKRRGHMKDDGIGGRKQMIIRLDSIEEESILVDQNGGGSIHQGQNNLAHTAYFNNTHSTFKSRKENTHKEILKKFNADFDELEEKFKNFEQKVENIREENKKFDENGDKKQPSKQGMLKIMNGKSFKETKQDKKKDSRLKRSGIKDFKQEESSEEQDMLNNPIIFAKRKLKNIEDYINGTEEEKNEKLKRIYGEWKLFGRPYKGKNYISPYKMDILNRIGTGQSNQKNPRKKNRQANQNKDQDQSDDSSQQSFDVKQVQPKQSKLTLNKSKMSKMPPMPQGKLTKGHQNMTQQFYPSSQDDFHEGGAKKLHKKSSQINSKSFEQLRKTQNLLHRAGAGIKVNTVDRMSQMQQKNQQGWGDKKGSFSNSFNHPKQKIIKNGRMLRSIEKVQGQGKIITKKNFQKLRRMNNSQKNMNRMVDRDGQSKLERKYQNKNQTDQFIGSGHSDDSGQLFKNFRSKKSQNISKSKEKLLSQNQIPKKGRQVYLNREGFEDVSHQQPYNNNEESLENNYFKEGSSKKSKPENRDLEKDQRVKKQYEKNIRRHKEWRESRIGSKQKKLSYPNEGQRSRSKNKSKQSKSFWMNSGEMTQQQRSSLIQEDHEQENKTSRQSKLQKTSIHKKSKNIEKQKLKRIQTDGDEGTEKQIVGKRKNKTDANREKSKKKKKRETIIELKDLEKSDVGQKLMLQNQSGSISEPSQNEDSNEQNQNSQVESENEQIEKSKQTFKKGQTKLSQENEEKEQNKSKKKGSPQVNKKLKTSKQKSKQNKVSKDQNEKEEKDDFGSFASSHQLDETEKQNENNEIEENQENNKSIKKDGKKLKKIQKQQKNQNSSQVKNSKISAPKQNDSSQEKEDESQGQIQSSQNQNGQQLNQENRKPSKKQNKNSKKGKKVQGIKNKPENGEKENSNQQDNEQYEFNYETQEKSAENLKTKKSQEISKKKGKKQPENGEEKNANKSDNQQDEIDNQAQEQGAKNIKVQKSQKILKKKEKKQKKQQKNQNQNQNDNDNEDQDQDEDENRNENEDEVEVEDQNSDENENENDEEKKNKINKDEAPERQQQEKGDNKTKEKLKLKSHSKAIKQEASRALLASGQTQRLNTARSVLSRNQIIGIYNDKDSEDNGNSQILDNEQEESIDEKGTEKNEENVQKKSPKKSHGKKKQNNDQENSPLSEINKDLEIMGKQSKKWTQISIIQQADIQQPDSPQLELFNGEEGVEKELEKKGDVVFETNQNEKNEVDDMDEEGLDQSEQQQIVLGQSKGPMEIFKNGRAPIIKQFYGESFKEQIRLYPSLPKQSTPLKNFTSFQNLTQTLPQNSIVSRLPLNIISSNPRLFNRKSIEVERITSNHSLPNLIKCLKILADINEFLIIRLFQNPLVKITKQNVLKKVFGVWLCVNYEWNCVIIDLNQILLSSESERGEFKPFYLNHSNNQLWPIVLEAALAKALKSYKFLANLPCHKLFNILTGSNSLFFNIKQDPSKNGRILRYISDCENKNFILHAEKICKNLEELEKSEKETKIYYVLSQKLVNQNEILLQIRESIRPDSQWMKLTKFVQEFKSIQILQLRLNHNFSSIKLPKPMNTNNLTIIELDYLEESFGSITLSTATGELCPILKTYLYKEEKSNVLKLVGEAKQKNKSTLFFDCFFGENRYYLFVESAVQSRVTYLGENQPLIKIIEQINSDGLRNDYTEYLPINSVSRNTQKTGFWGFRQMSLGTKMPNKLTKSRFGETGMSFKSQQDEKISRLRENFVEYLLKGTN